MTRSVHHLRVGDLRDPVGLDCSPPFLSWWVDADADVARRGRTVRSTRVQVCARPIGTSVRDDDADFASPLWDSGPLEGCLGHVRYRGPSLRPSTRYRWRVGVEDAEGSVEWSATATWETALDSWTAPWVGAQAESPDQAQVDGNEPVVAAVQYLRGEMHVPQDSEVLAARLSATALGWYAASLNGHDITRGSLVPTFTSFYHRVEFQTYDVTSVVSAGRTVIGLQLADGRFRGTLSGHHRRGVFGARTAASARLDVWVADDDGPDGVRHLYVETGADWTSHPGPVLQADPMFGTVVDNRRSIAGWDVVADPIGHWNTVDVIDQPGGRAVVPAGCAPVTETQVLVPVSITRVSADRTLVDFGQNMVGVADVGLRGARGQTVTLTYSEVLDERGREVDTDYLTEGTRLPRLVQRDVYTYAGPDVEQFSAPFTVHGFRHLQIDGPHASLDRDSVRARVLSADLEYAGDFSCSSDRLNQLFSNIVWSMRGNFTDVPTDCPTRERSGWTADIAVFAPAAVRLATVRGYLANWLVDLAIDQHPDGRPTLVVPSENSPRVPKSSREEQIDGASGWADAAVMVPWQLYEHYGDVEILRAQYASMTAWVDHQTRFAADNRNWTRSIRGRGGTFESFLVDTGFQFGEWMVPGENPIVTIVRNQVVPPAELATAYFAHSADLTARTAEVLGRTHDAQRYRDIAVHAAAAWVEAFLDTRGGRVRIDGDEQASYVRALSFGLIPEPHVAAAHRRLAELVVANGCRLDTGFLSTGKLLDVLAAGGRLDVAYAVLMQTDDPSWLYQVERGATTIWESWTGVDNSLRAHLSMNHYAFGAVAEWFFSTIGGIDASDVRAGRMTIAPKPGGRLRSARATQVTPTGPVTVEWEFLDRGAVDHPDLARCFAVRVSVPAGPSATVRLPAAAAARVMERGRELDRDDLPGGIVGVRVAGRDLEVHIGSGRYEFVYTAAGIEAPPIRNRRRRR